MNNRFGTSWSRHCDVTSQEQASLYEFLLEYAPEVDSRSEEEFFAGQHLGGGSGASLCTRLLGRRARLHDQCCPDGSTCPSANVAHLDDSGMARQDPCRHLS